MTQMIESTTQIRKALGSAYLAIRRFDILSAERSKTGAARLQLLKSRPHACGACGKLFARKRDADVAHVLSLQDGGRTISNNLVLLDRECHTLYHHGFASCKEMDNAAAAWRRGSFAPINELMVVRKEQSQAQHRILRPPMDRSGPLRKAAVYQLTQAGYWRQALAALRPVKERRLSAETKACITIIEAQIQRRRAKRGVLDVAAHLLEQLDISQLPIERLPLYYYELGYVKRLQGRHIEARQCFVKSERAAKELGDAPAALEAIMAKALQIGTDVISTNPRELPSSQVGATLQRIDGLARTANRVPHKTFGGGWALNCKVLKAWYLLKCGNPEAALQAFLDAEALRDGQNVTTGWVKTTGPGMAGTRGLILLGAAATTDEIREALRLIARALTTALSANRCRPEGVRDLLLGFEQGLKRMPVSRTLKAAKIADQITRVRQAILDGGSFLDPYTARETLLHNEQGHTPDRQQTRLPLMPSVRK